MKLYSQLHFETMHNWAPPQHMQTIETIDAHTEGEPLRVILNGFETKGSRILDRRKFAQQNLDHLRTCLMLEPRGHADMYGCVITPPERPDSHFGVLFLHNHGFSTMCGHGIIAIVTVAFETGLLTKESAATTIRIDTPAGLVLAQADFNQNKVKSVRFQNVVSFVDSLDQSVEVPGYGTIRYDMAFGGAYYAFVDVEDLNLSCQPEHANQLIHAGKAIKQAIAKTHPLKHPTDEDLGFLYGTIFVGKTDTNHSRHACIFADGELDRCPTGTGVSARLALLFERNALKMGETISIESILGTKFEGCVLSEASVAAQHGIVPQVSGRAWITGKNTFVLDSTDPLANGFLLR